VLGLTGAGGNGATVKRTTIGDVAAMAGVSVATVSRVLSGGIARQATASKVWDAAAQLDYTPNALTKSIFAGRSSTIGVVIDDLRSPFYLDLMRGIDEVADAHGSLVMFANTLHHAGRKVAPCPDRWSAGARRVKCGARARERRCLCGSFPGSGVPKSVFWWLERSLYSVWTVRRVQLAGRPVEAASACGRGSVEHRRSR